MTPPPDSDLPAGLIADVHEIKADIKRLLASDARDNERLNAIELRLRAVEDWREWAMRTIVGLVILATGALVTGIAGIVIAELK